MWMSRDDGQPGIDRMPLGHAAFIETHLQILVMIAAGYNREL
jgi:hypothetical protein